MIYVIRYLFVLFSTVILAVMPMQSAHGQKTNLAGQIWDANNKKFLSVGEMLDRLSTNKYILIGERHGRKAHQQREAFILAALAERKIYPKLFLEMIPRNKNALITAYRDKQPEYAGRLATLLDWANSNWPAWSFYQPVFNIALMAKLDIAGADLSDIEKSNINTLKKDMEIYDPVIRASWRKSMKKAHCNLIKEAQLEKVTQLQILRDKAMASTLKSAGNISEKSPALIIAGSSHTRNDRGIARYLDQKTSISIALIEADADQTMEKILPQPIDNSAVVYDLIWFTPKIRKETFCERFRPATEQTE